MIYDDFNNLPCNDFYLCFGYFHNITSQQNILTLFVHIPVAF